MSHRDHEARLAWQRAYYAKTRDKWLARCGEYRFSHKEEIAARRKAARALINSKDRERRAQRRQAVADYISAHVFLLAPFLVALLAPLLKARRDRANQYARTARKGKTRSRRELAPDQLQMARITDREEHARHRDQLTDAYVRKQLVKRTALTHADVPASLVALKRAQLMIKRELKKGTQQ